MRISVLLFAMSCLARNAAASPLVEYDADAAAANSAMRTVRTTLDRTVDAAAQSPSLQWAMSLSRLE